MAKSVLDMQYSELFSFFDISYLFSVNLLVTDGNAEENAFCAKVL